MRVHRFYVGSELELGHYVWLTDERILRQWQRVLRYRAGQQVVLFDGIVHDRLYAITEMKKDAAHLELITDFERKTPTKNIYLLWALLKKDKNDWVLQKCTELGVSHFVPVLAERSEKTGFNLERAQKIVIEAAEQCGRGDIPKVREPVLLPAAVHQYAQKVPLFMCEQESLGKKKRPNFADVGVLIGPEGGWSEAEKQLFLSAELPRLSLGDFTLRAETAAVAAITQIGIS